MRPHLLYREPRYRAQLYAVLESSFPGLCAKIDAARALGFVWDDQTTPFVDRDGDRVVSLVGVLDVPLRLEGRAVRVAGIHGVCTLPAHRRRGHFRRAMEQALRYVDERWELAELSTNEPEIYEPFGFRVIPTITYRAQRLAAPRADRAVPLDPLLDLPDLAGALATRTPISNRFAAMDKGWLLGIDCVLETGDLSLLWRVRPLSLFLVGQLVGERFCLYDVIASRLPRWSELTAYLPGDGPITLGFTPDRFPDAGARVADSDTHGTYMVRGPFPLEGRDFAVPPMARH